MRISLFVGLLLLAVSLDSMAATYYVATTGSDTNPGSLAAPFKTIPYGYSKLNPGDTLIVKSGIYSEYQKDYGVHFNRSGTVNAPITVKSEVPGGAIIDLLNKPDSFHALFVDAHYNVIQDFKLRNAFLGGIALYGSYNKFIGNEIYNNGNVGDPASSYGQDGIYSDSNVKGTLYLKNYVHHNGRISINSNLDHGFYLCGDDEVLINNIVSYNASYGLHVAGYSTVSNLKIYNNIVAFNGRSGGTLWQPVSNVEIKNNIFYKNARYGFETFESSGTGVVFENNIFFGNVVNSPKVFVYPAGSITVTETGSLTGNPLFMNETNDYRLQTGSPAIDAGVLLPLVTTDYFGMSRPLGAAFDIGIHEFGTPVVTPKISSPKRLRIK